jgi:hypothetical protein
VKRHVIEPGIRSGFDPVFWLPNADRLARAVFPDAGLTGIHIEQALADGTARMTTDPSPAVTYLYRSPSRSVRPAGEPANVEVDIPCMVLVWVSAERIEVSPVTDEECDAEIVPPPRCTTAHLWRKAFPRGPPRPGTWAALIEYTRSGWLFSVPGMAPDDPIGSPGTTLADDCR